MQHAESELKTKSEFEEMLFELDNLTDLDHESEWAGFVNVRLEELVKGIEPRRISPNTPSYDGFLHPDTEVRRSILVDGIKINDPEFYVSLLRTVTEFKKIYSGRGINEIIIAAIQYTIGRYYGNFLGEGDTDNRNRLFYMDKSSASSDGIDMKEQKDARMAVCVENAASAQNLLAFVGAKTTLVFSDCAIIPDSTEGHAYNIIEIDTGTYIYDPTNPRTVYNKTGQDSYLPALYKLKPESITALRDGQSITVSHTDYELNTQGKLEPKQITSRTYAGIEKRN